MIEIEIGQKYGQLECIEEAAPGYWRCRCLRCQYDGALATAGALRSGTAKMCFDCAELAKMTPEQKTVIAFRRGLGMSPEPLPIEWAAG